MQPSCWLSHGRRLLVWSYFFSQMSFEKNGTRKKSKMNEQKQQEQSQKESLKNIIYYYRILQSYGARFTFGIVDI